MNRVVTRQANQVASLASLAQIVVKSQPQPVLCRPLWTTSVSIQFPDTSQADCVLERVENQRLEDGLEIL
jgi:hypothetical protein